MKQKRPKTIHDTIQYFHLIGGTPEDANAFFDYFESNGWKVGGKAPMQDWKAASRTWMRNKAKWKKSESKPQAQRYYQREDEPVRTVDARQGMQSLKDILKH